MKIRLENKIKLLALIQASLAIKKFFFNMVQSDVALFCGSRDSTFHNKF